MMPTYMPAWKMSNIASQLVSRVSAKAANAKDILFFMGL